MKTIAEYLADIRKIEMNPKNTKGGVSAMMSGYNTYLTAAAQKQIASIEKKIDALADECDDD